ncbi:hypothetical protein [Aeromicrobium sp.]|uniref:hypothetical protein n=1 Tax=Aeromicrobium sp. TaxID=1871063 RepID=UPI003514D5A4
MDPRVIALLNETGGLLLRPRLLDLGLSPGEIRRHLRQGAWTAVRRGVYTTAEHWEGLDPHVGRPRLQSRAVIATMRRDCVLSHESAAHELGMGILAADPPLVHITRPGWTNAWTENGVRHHLAWFDPRSVVALNGVRALGRARTGVDIARDSGVVRGVVACDAALALGATREQLWREVEPMANWPGVRAARRAIELADAGAESPHESLGRLLLMEAGLTEIDTQFPVVTDRGLFWCDMRVGNLVIETDGRLKYRRQEAGGLALDPDQVIWDEKLRQRAIYARGLVIARLVWEDYWGARRQRAITALLNAYAESVQRSGSTLLPDLATEAETIRRRRPRRRPA